MRKNIISGVMILTASSLLIRVLGFVFRIFLSGKIGAEGMGLYQLVVSIYALGATISSSGVNMAVSRLVAINPKNGKGILKSALFITLILSVAAFLVVFLKAESIGLYFLKDERTILPLKIISASFPPIAIFACFSGYFYGKTQVKQPIYGQVVEQMVRIGIIFLLIDLAMAGGISHAVVLASFGVLIGEVASTLYLYLQYKKEERGRYEPGKARSHLIKILAISVPLSVGGYVSSALHTAESIMIPLRLGLFGMTHQQAVSALGILKGMVMPLIFFPTVLLTSVATVALPTISYAREYASKEKISYSVSRILKLAFVTAAFIVCLFVFFADQIMPALYKSQDGIDLLKAMAFLSPMIYLSIVMSSILTAMGLQFRAMVNTVIEGLLRLGLVYFLLPRFGISGYVFSVIATALFGCGLNLYLVFTRCQISFDFFRFFLSPGVSAILACFISIKISALLPAVLVCFLLYCMFLLITGTITWGEFSWVWHNIFKKNTKNMVYRSKMIKKQKYI